MQNLFAISLANNSIQEIESIFYYNNLNGDEPGGKSM